MKFDKKTIDEFQELSQTEMEGLLLEFSESIAYKALLKYIFLRDSVVFDGMFSLDPFKNPTDVARNQGIHLGLHDFPEYIVALKEQRNRKNNGNK